LANCQQKLVLEKEFWLLYTKGVNFESIFVDWLSCTKPYTWLLFASLN
jgi:hypothetical protein